MLRLAAVFPITVFFALASCTKSAQPESTPVPSPEDVKTAEGEPLGHVAGSEDGPSEEDRHALRVQEAADMAMKDRFEHLNFMTMSEVERVVGIPEETSEEEDRIRWYYLVMAKGPGGDNAGYPEVHFIDGEVRFVIYYPPEILKQNVATARLNKNWIPFKGARPRTFTMEEAFGAVPVGTGKDGVLSALGEPELKSVIQGFEVWQYNTLVVDQGSPRMLALRFVEDKVAEANGM